MPTRLTNAWYSEVPASISRRRHTCAPAGDPLLCLKVLIARLRRNSFPLYKSVVPLLRLHNPVAFQSLTTSANLLEAPFDL